MNSPLLISLVTLALTVLTAILVLAACYMARRALVNQRRSWLLSVGFIGLATAKAINVLIYSSYLLNWTQLRGSAGALGQPATQILWLCIGVMTVASWAVILTGLHQTFNELSVGWQKYDELAREMAGRTPAAGGTLA